MKVCIIGAGAAGITAAKARREASSVELDLTSNGAGTAQVFLWAGDTGYIPVWKTSCDEATDPAPDYGLSACSVADGDTPPWSPDMSGRVLAKREDVALGSGVTHITLSTASLTDAQREAVLARNYNAMLDEGGNIYFLAKIFSTDGLSFQHGAASMTGMTQPEYAAMMLAGGRSPEGQRSIHAALAMNAEEALQAELDKQDH